MSAEQPTCPSCARELVPGPMKESGDRAQFACECCGEFTCTHTALRMLEARKLEVVERAALMHRVRSAAARPGFVLDTKVLQLWLADLRLPSPIEQIENLILWLADHLRFAGDPMSLTIYRHQAIIGAADAAGFAWVLAQAEHKGWIQGNLNSFENGIVVLADATLTMSGWEAANAIRKTGKPSRQAFIAMKFGDPQLDDFLRAHLVPAVRATGFELSALDEGQPAGLIDDQIRVAIRRARFVVVELTHGSRGAYWEAGFAEGLGKPVIYLCREDVFNHGDVDERPHFDTSHLVTILWSPDALQNAASRLAACIRATLPDEAIMG